LTTDCRRAAKVMFRRISAQTGETMTRDLDDELPGVSFSGQGGAAPPAEELAAPFLDTLKTLARFGLASHSRLLLETSRQDG